MATRLTIDADLTEEQLRRDPIEVAIPVVGVATFPGVMPALAVMRVSRWQSAGKTDEIDTADAIALLGDFVDDKTIADWDRRGFNIFEPQHRETVEKVIMALLEEYARRDGEIAESGPSSGKARSGMTPPPYSGTGRSSGPTSGGNTSSPSPGT